MTVRKTWHLPLLVLSSREGSSSCFGKQVLTGYLRVRAPGKAWEIDNSFFLPEVENQSRH